MQALPIPGWWLGQEGSAAEEGQTLQHSWKRTCVRSTWLKSKISSLSSLRMCMLFSHSVSLVLLAATRSGMKLCHLWGQS